MSLTALSAASLVVLDANLPAQTLAAVADATTAPLLLDPVSVAKAPRARGLMSRLAAVKCNAAEAAALLDEGALWTGGSEVAGGMAAERAAALHAAGVGVAIVTDGVLGSAVAAAGVTGHVPAPVVPVVNATGAGDAFTAGVAAALAEGRGPMQAAEFGSELAALALSSEKTVSPAVTPDVLAQIRRRWRA
jgi:pseudouridine kinase